MRSRSVRMNRSWRPCSPSAARNSAKRAARFTSETNDVAEGTAASAGGSAGAFPLKHPVEDAQVPVDVEAGLSCRIVELRPVY
jgi:hypothetical protein